MTLLWTPLKRREEKTSKVHGVKREKKDTVSTITVYSEKDGVSTTQCTQSVDNQQTGVDECKTPKYPDRLVGQNNFQQVSTNKSIKSTRGTK